LSQIIDRLDRYSDPLEDFSSPELFMERRRPASSRRGKPAASATPSADPPRRVANAHRQASKGLKTLKMAKAGYWLKLARAWDRRRVR
jgi:hypothetical protein